MAVNIREIISEYYSLDLLDASHNYVYMFDLLLSYIIIIYIYYL